MRFILRVVIVFTVIALGYSLLIRSSKANGDDSCGAVHADITFCNFEVPVSLKKGYGNFSVTYSFDLGAQGRVQNIQKVSAPFENYEDVSKCLKSWNFVGVKEQTKVVAIFQWTHGIGWEKLLVKGECIDYAISLTGV